MLEDHVAVQLRAWVFWMDRQDDFEFFDRGSVIAGGEEREAKVQAGRQVLRVLGEDGAQLSQ